MVKRRLFLFVSIIAFFAFITSCELDENCKDCYIVTYNADGEEEGREYYGYICGDELDEIDGQSSTDPQGITTVFECF